MTFFEKVLKKGYDIDAKEYQTDASFTYLEDNQGTDYRMNMDEDQLIVFVCYREPEHEDWRDMSDVDVSEELEVAV